jgi:AcrR family transcriptional regulator
MTTRIKGSQARSQQTRTAILASARTLLTHRRFDEITLSEIAVAAGIAKGSVLAHFSEKLSILASFLADAMDRTTEALRADPACAAQPETLVAKLLPLLDFLKTDRALARLLSTDGDASQCAILLDPAQARLRAALVTAFATQPDADLAADVTMALAVHVAVAAECQTGAAAGVALRRLLDIVYR